MTSHYALLDEAVQLTQRLGAILTALNDAEPTPDGDISSTPGSTGSDEPRTCTSKCSSTRAP